MALQAQIGARIVVPLGRRLVTGFIVGLHNEFDQTLEITENEIKEADSIIDSTPVCTPEVLAITRWVSDYYISPWGETIKAALPRV